MVKKDRQLTAFLHKCTEHKVEVACIIANDISRKNIDRLHKNMNRLKEPAEEFVKYSTRKLSYLRFTHDKKSSGTESEGKRKYIHHKDTVMLGRVYKLVGVPWHKIEITVPVDDGDYQKAIDNGLEVLRKSTKGLKKSQKPYYMQNGDIFLPLE